MVFSTSNPDEDTPEFPDRASSFMVSVVGIEIDVSLSGEPYYGEDPNDFKDVWSTSTSGRSMGTIIPIASADGKNPALTAAQLDIADQFCKSEDFTSRFYESI